MADQNQMIRLINPFEEYEKGRQRVLQEQQAAMINQLYSQALDPRTGQIRYPEVYSGLARAGMGSAIPELQETEYKRRQEYAKTVGTESENFLKKIDMYKRTIPQTPGEAMNWVIRTYEDPDVGPIMSYFGSMEEAVNGVPRDPEGFAKWRRDSALFADKLMENEIRDLEGGYGSISKVTGEQVGPTVMKVPYSPELAAQRRGEKASEREYNPEIKEVEDPDNPDQILLVDVKRWRGGGIGSPGVIGPKGRAPVEKGEKAGDAFGAVIDEMEQNYNELDRLGAIPSTRRSAQENLAISARTSQVGQMLGRASGTQEQSLRNQIQSARLRLLQGIKAATGMSAQELNSNVELQQWLDAVTNPANDVESNKAILNSIRSFVEANKPRGRAPAAPAREALSPRDQQALDWARKNPRDPRAAQIKQRLGVK
jgi:hypothetical protein